MNYFKLLIFLSSLLLNSSCSHSQEKSEKHLKETNTSMNHLAKETSPYLLQHAKNPVDWYPWNEDALQKAKDENKLLIISIGYAACHWCHVMEHESFEDEEVAQFMNEHFISIKVDREERPDIDQVYMDAVQLITGRGGWPLNAIALPDGRPIHGGTYFQKKEWLNMLAKIVQFKNEQPEKLEEYATNLTNGIQQKEMIYAVKESQSFTKNDLKTIFKNWKPNIDYLDGGNKGAPKFPLPVGYQYLLQHHSITNDRDALQAVTLTLDKMAEGGIYDQIGGGFARYSTDAYWKAPHFEKMLYDNGQLVSLYSSAYQVTKNPLYKTIVYETLEFIERELSDKNAGFYSSLDADSEGEEGKFYVWTQKELEDILKDDVPFIIDYYNVEKNGNWEHGNNILLINDKLEKTAKKHDLSVENAEKLIKKTKKQLLSEREKRIRPGLDDKILTSWNALMLKGYIDAYRVFDDEKFLKTALKNANFILKEVKKEDGRLDRNFKNSTSKINGFLDDYALTIEAFVDLYQATFDEKWLFEAKELSEYTITHFFDNTSGMFFYTSDIDPALIARKMEVSDNVIPSSNSTMAKNLFKLGHYFYKDNYIKISKNMLSNVKDQTIVSGAYYAKWASLMAWFSEGVYDVAIVGNDFETKRKDLDQNYLPNVFYSGGKNEGSLELLEMKLISGETTIYVCKDKSCKKPTDNTESALEQIKDY